LRWGFYAPRRQLWYWDAVDHVEVTGDLLVFRLHHPSIDFPSLLWGTHTAICNQALRERDLEAFGSKVADGTGPLRLRAWSPHHIVAERWADYPGAPAPFLRSNGPARVDRIEWLSIPSERDRLEALERGEVHCIHGPVASEFARLEADPRFQVRAFPQGSNFYLGLNWERRDLGFDDHRVRQAISLAVDRRRLVDDAMAGRGQPTWGPIPPGDPYYDPAVDQHPNTDPARAAALLDAAGWQRGGPDGVRGRAGVRLAFSCVIQDDDVHRRVATGVREQLAHVGVALELFPVAPFQDFYAAMQANPASFINKWLWQDGMDAIIGFSASWVRPFPNAQGSAIPELDEAFHSWVRAETDEQLRAAASRAQHVAAERLPYIPLLTPDDLWAWDRRVHGWEPSPANLYPFYHSTWIED
jgi:peptide/nickel transport system substrate-binding protein